MSELLTGSVCGTEIQVKQDVPCIRVLCKNGKTNLQYLKAICFEIKFRLITSVLTETEQLPLLNLIQMFFCFFFKSILDYQLSI